MMLPTLITVRNSSNNENCEDHELGRYQIFPTRAKGLLIEQLFCALLGMVTRG